MLPQIDQIMHPNWLQWPDDLTFDQNMHKAVSYSIGA